MEQYRSLAKFYDLTYEAQGKDYKAEAAIIKDLIKKFKKSSGKKLLDVGCGTGKHLTYLKGFERSGMDLNKEILAAARKKNPSVKFSVGDMTSFSLGKKFDIITCLFSAIGYVRTKNNLEKTCTQFANHLHKGGVAIIEPWFQPQEFRKDNLSFTPVKTDRLSIARMGITTKRKNESVVLFHWLIGERGKGITYIKDEHILGLFTKEETTRALERAGFTVKYYKKGITSRGIYVAIKN